MTILTGMEMRWLEKRLCTIERHFLDEAGHSCHDHVNRWLERVSGNIFVVCEADEETEEELEEKQYGSKSENVSLLFV